MDDRQNRHFHTTMLLMIGGVLASVVMVSIILWFVGQVSEASKSIEEEKLEVVAKEIGVDKKGVILEAGLLSDTYTAYTEGAEYIIQFEDDVHNIQIKSIVKTEENDSKLTK